MATCKYWKWSGFVLDVLTTSATSALKYLPPGAFCTVEYPFKLRKHGKRKQIYTQVVDDNSPGPFYILECTLWHSTGKTVLLTTTFLVPCRDPGDDVDDFRAEWNQELWLYIVRRMDLPTKGARNKSSWPAEPDTGISTCSSISSSFCINYFSHNHDFFIEDQSQYQYELDFFAVRDVVINPIKSPSKIPSEDITPTVEESESVRGTDIDAVLKPEHFNWADEVEMEMDAESSVSCSEDQRTGDQSPFIVSSPVPSQITTSSPEPAGASSPAREGVAGSEEADLEMLLEPRAFDPADQVEMDIDNRQPSAPDPDSSLPCPAVNSKEVKTHISEDDGLSKFLIAMHSKAQDEMTRQGSLMEAIPGIHHFNWLGQPVMERCRTPPEESLFVICKGPKRCLGEELREGVLMKEGLRFIDPVVYTGDRDALCRYGNAFVKAVSGQTFPFYTNEGTRVYDENAVEESDWIDNVEDPCSPDIYLGDPAIPFNGWFQASVPHTREQFMKASRDLARCQPRRRRYPGPFVSSPLRQCLVVDTDENRSHVVDGRVQDLDHEKPVPEEPLLTFGCSDRTTPEPLESEDMILFDDTDVDKGWSTPPSLHIRRLSELDDSMDMDHSDGGDIEGNFFSSDVESWAGGVSSPTSSKVGTGT